MVARNKSNFIDTVEAMEIVSRYGKKSVSKPTLIKWVRANKIGHQIISGSRWYINKNKLIKLLEKGKAFNANK